MNSSLLAQVTREFKEGVEVEEGVATLRGLEAIFSNMVSVILGLAGIVLFLLLVIGGFRYITSGGDPKKVEQARNTLTYAIAGILVIALSFLVLRIIQELTGADVTEFRIFQAPFP